MIFEFLVILVFLTFTGFPIISLFFPSTNTVFRLGCAAYFASLIIITSASVFLRVGLNINASIIPFILISLVAWRFIFKETIKSLVNINTRANLKTIIIVGLIILISCPIVIYPSLRGAYGIYHARPDFYGYGMVASYLQEKNRNLNPKQAADNAARNRSINSIWSLGDLREAISVVFISVGSNRYGLQSVAAVLDNLIFQSNSAVKLLYPLMAISLIATLSSVYQLIIAHRLKILYALFAVLLAGFNINNLVSIIEGNLASVFVLPMPLLLVIIISSFFKSKKQIAWPPVFAMVILLSSSLVAYEEITQLMSLYLIFIFIFLIIVRDKKNILNLAITGIIFFVINFDILINYISLIYQVYHKFPGSYDIGFLDIANALGLNQPYRHIITRSASVIEQSTNNPTGTIIMYFILLIIAFIEYKYRRISEAISIVFFLGVLCLGIIFSQNVVKNNYITWKLTYALFPFIAISVVLLIANIKKYLDKFNLRHYTTKAVLIIFVFTSSIVILNYLNLYKAYAQNSEFVFNEESKAFQKGTYSDSMILTMSENQLYYVPSFHGRFYWLNSGWIPVFDKNLRNKVVTLVIFKQVEGEKFFKDAKRYFNKTTLYSNDMVIITNLNIPASAFLKDDNRTDRKYMQEFLDILGNKIIKST